MHYLKTYPDSIGISHYLCYRMKSMPAEEVEFYWPQIWCVPLYLVELHGSYLDQG